MSLPLNVSCFSKIQIDFTFLVPAHPRSPRKRAVKRVCVCVCACVRVCVCIIQRLIIIIIGWLSSRVVSALDSGAERAWVQIAAATLSGNSLRQTVHTHPASVHQAAKLVAALLRVAGITAGLADRLPPGL